MIVEANRFILDGGLAGRGGAIHASDGYILRADHNRDQTLIVAAAQECQQ